MLGRRNVSRIELCERFEEVFAGPVGALGVVCLLRSKCLGVEALEEFLVASYPRASLGAFTLLDWADF